MKTASVSEVMAEFPLLRAQRAGMRQMNSLLQPRAFYFSFKTGKWLLGGGK